VFEVNLASLETRVDKLVDEVSRKCDDLMACQQNADAFQKAFRNSARLHPILAKKWKAPDTQPK